MADKIPLASGNGWGCYRQDLSNSSYISCQFGGKKSEKSLPESRHWACEIPGQSHQQAMGQCMYSSGEMKRCGCPTLDPKKTRNYGMITVTPFT